MSFLLSRKLPFSIAALALSITLVGCKAEAGDKTSEAGSTASKAAVSTAQKAPQAVPAELVNTIEKKFQQVRPELRIQSVEPTDIQGLYEATFIGKGSVYVFGEGEYFMSGDLIQLTDQKFVNVKQKKMQEPRRMEMAKVSRDDMIIFSPKGEVKASIAVFTDVDCGYCRKLHQEVAKMNDMGIEVKYLAYPRAGVGSGSYDKIASAWCAKDPNDAMAKLKGGQQIPIAVCDGNPVASQFQLGGKLGVTGTPAIILESGELIPGYKPAEALAKDLGVL